MRFPSCAAYGDDVSHLVAAILSAVSISTSPLPGALLVADRGNDRMLLVDSQHHVLWSFPTARDRARGIHLNFNDDGFVEPGGNAIVSKIGRASCRERG